MKSSGPIGAMLVAFPKDVSREKVWEGLQGIGIPSGGMMLRFSQIAVFDQLMTSMKNKL
jgi:PDZ domain-containing secreted protein